MSTCAAQGLAGASVTFAAIGHAQHSNNFVSSSGTFTLLDYGIRLGPGLQLEVVGLKRS
jgi:hypothetical protein